jgi:hypothetical protein
MMTSLSRRQILAGAVSTAAAAAAAAVVPGAALIDAAPLEAGAPLATTTLTYAEWQEQLLRTIAAAVGLSYDQLVANPLHTGLTI